MSEEKELDIRVVRPIIENFFDFDVVQGDLLKKAPVHIGGNFQSVRLFGGQTVAQCYSAAKKIYPDKCPELLDTNFIAPGSVTKDLFYRHRELSHDLIQINVEQNGNVIANATIRMKPRPDPDRNPPYNATFPAHVKDPFNYKNVNAYLTNLPQKEWRRQSGRDERFETKEDVYLFDWRPINIQKYLGISGEREVTYVWARLADSVRDLPIADPLAIPILMSDWIIGHPIHIYHRQLQVKLTTSASMTHKLIFHQDDVNPHGFFLMQLDMDVVKDGTGLVRGEIFDENHNIVLSFMQNHYYVTDEKALAEYNAQKSRL
ncbi:unnamed protein product [Bursaphelenchus xylophilus]|uniref:(pine wood nematode) hypothetical protein n=1 Tax=Bursaphelenchus xylophilus TaxID=6326 RepID=A0A1I7SDG2_BURXY|nr:unnamed protein product [Bursaphelenchus xylophilus]CAG9131693.1 unnamed protein product [Bursaphelenchus xylophilus]